MLSPADRADILALVQDDPGYMVDLLEQVTYDGAVDVTPLREARLIIEELSCLCATVMGPGLSARVARWLSERDSNA